jgi:hypothetical protein
MYKKIFILLAIASFFTSCSLTKSRSGLEVKSNPNAKLFINGKENGTTPFKNENLTPGEYTIKLISDQGEWTSNVIPIAENTTYHIFRELTKNPEDQAGENVGLEKGRGISIVTTPASVEISLDGQKQGNSPYIIPSVSAGTHELTLSKDGYQSRTLKVKTFEGYKIVVEIQLRPLATGNDPKASPSASPSNTASASASPTESPKGSTKPTVTPKASPTPKSSTAASTAPTGNTITILSTPTGWLRVRDKAGIDGKEIAKVNTGETYQYEQQLDTGWTEIILSDGTKGYVATKYVKVNK